MRHRACENIFFFSIILDFFETILINIDRVVHQSATGNLWKTEFQEAVQFSMLVCQIQMKKNDRISRKKCHNFIIIGLDDYKTGKILTNSTLFNIFQLN